MMMMMMQLLAKGEEMMHADLILSGTVHQLI